MIPFNAPTFIGIEEENLIKAVTNKKLSGDGVFNRECCSWLETHLFCRKAHLTPSCTHALEMCALLLDIKPGDEVIMPSFTFVSTANAFVLRGAKIVFVDIRPDTMNINEKLIEEAITAKTKVIVPVHYAGVACEMDKITKIAARHKIVVVEDAAQAIMSKYKDQFLGTIGQLGCFSFHETKNITCGEGGALIVNSESYSERAEIIREKGTDRSRFFRGEVDKYTWVDIGSSYLLSELNAAYLIGQLEYVQEITKNRLISWGFYYEAFEDLAKRNIIELPFIPGECYHNGHIFYIKVKDLQERTRLISHLHQNNIHSVFHYIPLHSSKAGRMYGRFQGVDRYTTMESERLLRLPLYAGLRESDVERVTDKVKEFYSK